MRKYFLNLFFIFTGITASSLFVYYMTKPLMWAGYHSHRADHLRHVDPDKSRQFREKAIGKLLQIILLEIHKLAYCCEQQGDWEGAFSSYQHAADLARRNEPELAVKFYRKTAIIADDYLNDIGKARFYFLESLRYGGKDSTLVTSNLCSLGIVESGLGNLIDAQGYYVKAFSIHEKKSDFHGCAHTLNCLANNQIDQGEISQAVQTCHRGLEFYHKHCHDETLACCLYDTLGCAYAAQPDFERSKECFLKAIQYSKSADMSFSTKAEGYIHFGDLYRDHGDKKKAKTYYQAAQRACQEPEIIKMVQDRIISL